MNRGADFKKAIPHSTVDFYVAVLGAGAAAPTLPADGAFTPTTATYPRRANGVSKLAAEIPTRSATGVYVVTTAHLLANVLFATAAVYSAGGSPTSALVADVTIINAATRQLTIKVFAPNGTATDLSTSDMLVIKCEAQDSGA